MDKYGGYTSHPHTADMYDLVPAYVRRTDRDFYVRYCREARGRILELGCGTGRVLIPAARAGAAVTGLDVAESMLSRCRDKLREEPQEVRDRVTLVHGDMTDFDLGGKFKLVIIPFRPFQHLLATDEQLACLRCINRHLDADGKLVFDVFQVDLNMVCDPHAAEEVEDVSEYEIPDGRRLRRSGRVAAFHRAEQYNDVELIYYVTSADGTTERIVHAFPLRYFFRYEIEHLLARCGFKIIELFGDFDKSPLTDGSPEMIFVAGN
ncbi:MAG: class I SAM-dependent methyltransferase [candidate division Zixibacteria bacterium]|nr:class I SAM-dependent methyltransferase [candidate division Zixibacteria bacterium]